MLAELGIEIRSVHPQSFAILEIKDLCTLLKVFGCSFHELLRQELHRIWFFLVCGSSCLVQPRFEFCER